MLVQGAMTFYEISNINMEAFKIQNEKGKKPNVLIMFLKTKMAINVQFVNFL